MDTTLDRARPPARRVLRDQNLFYPLSALCMLAGCYLLSEALRIEPGGAGRLLALVGVLQVYELLLISLGLYLIVRRRLPGDGRLLLVIEVTFLVDAAHLNAELFAADPVIGGAANAVIFLLALMKVWLIARILGIRWPARHWIMLAAAFGFMTAMPGALAVHTMYAEVTAWPIYTGWWMTGVLLAAHGLWGRPARRHPSPSAHSAIQVPLQIALIVGVYGSLLGHLAAQGWVYRVEFAAAFATPILLGLSLCCGTAVRRWIGSATAGRIEYLLPALAVLASLHAPDELTVEWAAAGGLVVSPLRLALVGAAAVYAVHVYRRRRIGFVLAGSVCAAATVLGHSAGSIMARGVWIGERVWAIVPRSALAWGLVAVSAAFVLLATGALRSLLRGRRGGGPGAGAQ